MDNNKQWQRDCESPINIVSNMIPSDLEESAFDGHGSLTNTSSLLHHLCTSDHTAMIDCHDHITHSFLEQCMAIWWPTEETGMVCKSMNEWMECYTSPIILHPIETFNHPIIVLIYGQIDCEIIELLAEIFWRFGLGLLRVWFGQTMSIIMEYCTCLLHRFYLHSNFFNFFWLLEM